MTSRLPLTAPVRLAVVGLGQISELMLPAYAANESIDIVGLCDRNPERLRRWSATFPDALAVTEIDDVLATMPDVVDVLVPTPLHAEVVTPILAKGFHVQVQKPIARDLGGADRMLAAAARGGATLNVLEDYLCYPPIVKLSEIVRSGEIGEPVGCHMKIVATGLGGWEVLPESYEWQFRAGTRRPGHAGLRPRMAPAGHRPLPLRTSATDLRLDRPHRGHPRDHHGCTVHARLRAQVRRACCCRHHLRGGYVLPFHALRRR